MPSSCAISDNRVMSETTPSGLDKLSANKALTFLDFIACFTSS